MIWELAQLPLYAGHDDLGLRLLYRAGGNDAALILVAAGIGRVADRWSRPWAWTTLLVTLAATAVFIEVRAITTGRWAYSHLMPTLGIVGLSPLAATARDRMVGRRARPARCPGGASYTNPRSATVSRWAPFW